MKPANVSQIKKALEQKSKDDIQSICLRLAKFKKENKELLTYILFESENENAYIEYIKEEVKILMKDINTSHVYYIKKGLRKVLRYLNRCIRYSGNPQSEVELRIFFCQQIKNHKLPVTESKILNNIYNQQIIKIKKSLSQLHEDLVFDYKEEIKTL